MSNENGQLGETGVQWFGKRGEIWKKKRHEDIEYDHVASITSASDTHNQHSSHDHKRTATASAARSFMSVVWLLACCETRLHFIPNTKRVFIRPSPLAVPLLPTMLSLYPAGCTRSGQLSIHWKRGRERHTAHIHNNRLQSKSFGFYIWLFLCVSSENFVRWYRELADFVALFRSYRFPCQNIIR